MKKAFKFVLIVVASLLIIINGCKKDDDEPNPAPVQKKLAWVVGDADSTNYGMILFSSDGENTWVRQGEGSTALQGIDVNDVCIVDENTVWAVCSDNIILKTTDRGNTWVRIPAPANRAYIVLMSISLVNNDNLWISGSPGIVYNSTDAGNSWMVFDTSFFHSGLMQGIHAINSQIVYVAGGVGPAGGNLHGFIARTTDGGQTWDSIVPDSNFNKHEWIGVTSSDPDHIIVYGGKSHYIYSNDAGQSWKNDSVPGIGGGGGPADINCLKMLDAQTWWGAFDYDGIARTENSGTTWTKQISVGPQGEWLVGIDYYDYDHAIIVGQGSSSYFGKIINTSNGGNLWELKDTCNTLLNNVSCIIE